MKKIFHKNLDFAEVDVYNNGIIHTHYTNYSPVLLNQVKELVELRLKIFLDRKALILSSSVSDTTVPNEEALKFLHSKERTDQVLAHAYLIKGFSQQLSIKTSTTLAKYANPTQGFKTIPEAIDWLLSFAPDSSPMDIPHHFKS